MIKAVLAADDESDEGASPLLDMTKVTRSTLAEKPLPRVMNKVLNNTIRKDTEAASCANSTSKCDTRLCRLTVLFEYLDRLPESETFPRS